MKVVIIEDEIPAAEKLERYLQRYDPGITVLKKIQTVSESVQWFRNNQDAADLIFMDIQLVDGQSFAIFEQVEVNKPVIFTTAYDEYALKAFEVNSIAYLLKPISYADLIKAIDKFKQTRRPATELELTALLRRIDTSRSYKSRFMIKIGDHIRSVTIDEIVYFYAEGRNAYIINKQGRRLIIDYKLEELEEILDPSVFYRVNRTFIININYVKDVLVYSNSRLKVLTEVDSEKEIIVSREKVAAFKQWFAGD
jgi:two-component system LytT family response regulator